MRNPCLQFQIDKQNRPKLEPNGAYNGTSHAAALTSFVAGLVSYLGVTEPDTIKARIMSGSDYIKSLEDRREAIVPAVLNPIKAISVHHDVVEVSNQQCGPDRLCFGSISEANVLGMASICSADDKIDSESSQVRIEISHNLEKNKIRKIIPNQKVDGKTEIGFWFEHSKNRRKPLNTDLKCEQKESGEKADFVLETNDGRQEIFLKDIVDITFADERYMARISDLREGDRLASEAFGGGTEASFFDEIEDLLDFGWITSNGAMSSSKKKN